MYSLICKIQIVGIISRLVYFRFLDQYVSGMVVCFTKSEITFLYSSRFDWHCYRLLFSTSLSSIAFPKAVASLILKNDFNCSSTFIFLICRVYRVNCLGTKDAKLIFYWLALWRWQVNVEQLQSIKKHPRIWSIESQLKCLLFEKHIVEITFDGKGWT